MKGLKELLLQEQTRLITLNSKARKRLENAPEGYLRISKDKNKLRYYHCVDDNNGTYISRKNEELPRMLAEKSYDLSVVRKTDDRIRQINKLLYDYSDDEIECLYTSLHDGWRKLIAPLEQTWEQKVEEWMRIPYQGKHFGENCPLILTNRGERVRSKSEKILADYFDARGIAYKYECPLNLKSYGVVYPDFTFLSCQTGREIYWEHEGMMDNPEYARSAVRKIELYEKNGIYPGERLILTFETSTSVISTALVKELTEKYLL